MDDMILSVNTLPEPLHRRFRSERVRVREENGSVILTPVADTNPKHTSLWGLLPEGLFTTEEYFAQKRQDKELEP